MKSSLTEGYKFHENEFQEDDNGELRFVPDKKADHDHDDLEDDVFKKAEYQPRQQQIWSAPGDYGVNVRDVGEGIHVGDNDSRYHDP